MKVNLSHDNAFQRIEKIRNYIGCSKKDFSSMLEISPAALNNINVNKRSLSSDLIIKLIDLKVSPIFIYFGIGTPFDEKYNQFLESYNDYKNEIVDEKDNDLEEYIFYNLKRIHKLERSFFNLFFPTSEFLTRYLSKFEESYLDNLTIKNSKNILIDFLVSIKINKVIDSENKRKKVIDSIKNDFSRFEIFVLLKNYKFFSS